MGQALILEVADHRGRVRDRTRLGAAPLKIGRGYGNDLILDDPYVDAEHLLIEPTEGGDWTVTDLGTRNGTLEHTGGHQIKQAILQAGHELKVGRSTIRVLSVDHPVPAALQAPRGGAGGVISRSVEPKLVGPILGVGLALSAVSQYYGSSSEQGFIELVTPGLAALLFAAIWATFWAFTNRIVAQRFRFLSHLGWTVFVAIGFSVLSLGMEWIEFFTPSIDWSVLKVAGSTGLFALLLAGHLQLVTEWSAARQWRVAVTVAAAGVVIVGIIGQSDLLENGDGTTAVDRSSLKPVSARLIASTSVDRFFEKTEDLRKDVDDLAGDDEPDGEAEPPAAPDDSAPAASPPARPVDSAGPVVSRAGQR
jgi:hypothetical protein